MKTGKGKAKKPEIFLSAFTVYAFYDLHAGIGVALCLPGSTTVWYVYMECVNIINVQSV